MSAGAGAVNNLAGRCLQGVHGSGVGRLGSAKPVGAVKNKGGVDQSLDHHAIPVGEDFVVAARLGALIAYGQQVGTGSGKVILRGVGLI